MQTLPCVQTDVADLAGYVKTVESMIESGCAGIVMEACRTLLVEREKALDLANRHKLVVVAMKDSEA